jgi:futalosine hydrolase
VIVAATEPELCGREGFVCGVGPVEAAASTARLLAERSPAGVLHVGIGGARRDYGLAVGQLVLGTVAIYEDLVQTTGLSPTEVAPDAELAAAARAVLPEAAAVSIGTTGRIGGTSLCPVEAMEGFAVLRAAALAGVPAVEIRAISNIVEDARDSWRIGDALEALDAALSRLLPALGEIGSPP